MNSKLTLKTMVFAISCVISSLAFGQSTNPSTLNKKEKIQDFESLYNELKESYPYFEINKRLYGVDWLSSYSIYKRKIKKTKTDKDFYLTIVSILNDLNNDHTDTYPTVIYPYFYRAYKGLSLEDSLILPFVKELEKTDTIKTEYWAKINQEILEESSSDSKIQIESTGETKPNIEVFNFPDSSITILKIRSFSYDLLEDDISKLKEYLATINNFKHLIIDIQGNNGGTTEYWSDYIVPYLIDDTLSYSSYYAFKKAEKLQYFKPNYFIDSIPFSTIQLPNMPEELNSKDWAFRKMTNNIVPAVNDNGFKGKIYLLVDKTVFSSAEAMAVMFKITQLGQVVGEKTNGDGIGTDPLLFTLPNSGIVIRYTGEMGLNPDGSANDETKTIPDVIIQATSEQERLQKLINVILKN